MSPLTEPVRVALPMLTLVPGAMGGSETYARALTEQLATTDEVDAVALVPANAAGFSEGIREEVIRAVQGGASISRWLGAVASAQLSGGSIRRRMRDAQVVHYPFTVAAPLPGRHQALVQSLLDVQHLDLPQMFGRAELAWRRRFYEGTARKADVVITISHFAKKRMRELLSITGDRIVVAHLGVDAASYTAHTGPRREFVLYPARGWPHKNHRRLIEAMEIVRRTNPHMALVLTGGGLESLGDLPRWVDRRGLVSAADLRELYRSASVLAFPSLYEGFGLPPLEAMASGCPTAVANSGSLPEVCGDASAMFDPHDPVDIARGILEAVDRRQQLVRAGFDQVARFTWEACRDVHVSAYRLAMLQWRGSAGRARTDR